MFKLFIKWSQTIRGNRKIKQLNSVAVLGKGVNASKEISVKNMSNIKGNLQIGDHCMIGGVISIGKKGSLTIGHHCSFKTSNWISAKEKVVIGNHVFGSELVFISDNDNHPISPLERKEMTEALNNTEKWKIDREDVKSAPVVIEDCVWLGRACIILKGVTIGRGSIVAAGAIVTKSVPPFSIVAGNPAQVVKKIENDLDKP
jgi:acetyltransferase-like isoleucine patch superfamily enzyme